MEMTDKQTAENGRIGQGRPGPGRPKGSKNKATRLAREAISQLVDGNVHRLQGWLDAIEQEEGPRAALTSFLALLEFAVPKLARTELTGKDTADPLSVRVHFAHPPCAQNL
jgi:hypothetical protein